MYCTNCGNEMGEAKFCTECGAKAGEGVLSSYCACGFDLTDFVNDFCPQCGTVVNEQVWQAYENTNLQSHEHQNSHKRILRILALLSSILGPVIAIIRGFMEHQRVYNNTIRFFGSGAQVMASQHARQAVENIWFSLFLIAGVGIVLGIGLFIAAGLDNLPADVRLERAEMYVQRVKQSLRLFLISIPIALVAIWVGLEFDIDLLILFFVPPPIFLLISMVSGIDGMVNTVVAERQGVDIAHFKKWCYYGIFGPVLISVSLLMLVGVLSLFFL